MYKSGTYDLLLFYIPVHRGQYIINFKSISNIIIGVANILVSAAFNVMPAPIGAPAEMDNNSYSPLALTIM